MKPIPLRRKAPKEVAINLSKTEADLKIRWPWDDDSVDSAEAVHVLQFFTAAERIHFVNELYRVLKPEAKATILTPHWASNRAYGDLAFEWPPVVEQWYWHLNRKWREENNPKEKRYTCDFDPLWGYNLHPQLVARNHEHQVHAVTFFKEAAQDLVATLTKR